MAANDAANAPALSVTTDNEAALAADRFYGSADFHETLRGNGVAGLRSVRFNPEVPRIIDGELLIVAEAVRDAPLLQVIGGHLQLHAITGENPNAMDSHATRQVAENRVISGLSAQDANLEHGVWKSLINNADQFNNVL